MAQVQQMTYCTDLGKFYYCVIEVSVSLYLNNKDPLLMYGRKILWKVDGSIGYQNLLRIKNTEKTQIYLLKEGQFFISVLVLVEEQL